MQVPSNDQQSSPDSQPLPLLGGFLFPVFGLGMLHGVMSLVDVLAV